MVSKAPDNKPPQSPQESSHEPSLDTLALAEWLAELRAAGDAPHLSALIAALPDAAGDLADATMLDALVAEAETETEAEAADPQMGETTEDAAPSALSPGTQRAVANVFGVGDKDALAMVAETPATYGVTMAAGVDAAVGLLALAQEQGLDVEALAARIMLSPDVVRWLDRIALPREDQPDALVVHLVGALGVPRERVLEALAFSNAATDAGLDAGTDNLVETLTTSASLTPAQRAYWATQLAGQE